MTRDEIVKKMIEKPVYTEMGAGKLARTWNISREDVTSARKEAKEKIAAKSSAASAGKLKKELKDENKPARYTGSETTDDGVIKKFESPSPLSPKEIEDLVQVDNINTRVKRVWDRLLPNGVWVYSVDIKYDVQGFYTKDELKDKLKELFPSIKAQSLPTVKRASAEALMILISDDHCGAVNKNSLYGNTWGKDEYQNRLLSIVNEAKALGKKFEEVHVISLGDQMNGWNSQTTRGGHEVKSLSNKEQFDIYTQARIAFYNDLFTSGIAASYMVHDVENSNHTGRDFSYMANKLLEVYIESKFPEVKRKSYFLPVDSFTYGIHTIGIGHGKDEALMTRPMPLKLDQKTDLFLYQYFDTNGVHPSKNRITFYKGDLHSYAVDKGKFGRYINIPSIMGGTDWTEVNFGNSEPGALMEILPKDSKSVTHIPIWF